MTPCELQIEWQPVPRRPWRLLTQDGRTFKRFDSLPDALDWLSRNGYASQEVTAQDRRGEIERLEL